MNTFKTLAHLEVRKLEEQKEAERNAVIAAAIAREEEAVKLILEDVGEWLSFLLKFDPELVLLAGGYSDDQPRDRHGRWTAAATAYINARDANQARAAQRAKTAPNMTPVANRASKGAEGGGPDQVGLDLPGQHEQVGAKQRGLQKAMGQVIKQSRATDKAPGKVDYNNLGSAQTLKGGVIQQQTVDRERDAGLRSRLELSNLLVKTGAAESDNSLVRNLRTRDAETSRALTPEQAGMTHAEQVRSVTNEAAKAAAAQTGANSLSEGVRQAATELWRRGHLESATSRQKYEMFSHEGEVHPLGQEEGRVRLAATLNAAAKGLRDKPNPSDEDTHLASRMANAAAEIQGGTRAANGSAVEDGIKALSDLASRPSSASARLVGGRRGKVPSVPSEPTGEEADQRPIGYRGNLDAPKAQQSAAETNRAAIERTAEGDTTTRGGNQAGVANSGNRRAAAEGAVGATKSSPMGELKRTQDKGAVRESEGAASRTKSAISKEVKAEVGQRENAYHTKPGTTERNQAGKPGGKTPVPGLVKGRPAGHPEGSRGRPKPEKQEPKPAYVEERDRLRKEHGLPPKSTFANANMNAFSKLAALSAKRETKEEDN